MWMSCMTWPELNSTFTVNYYFTGIQQTYVLYIFLLYPFVMKYILYGTLRNQYTYMLMSFINLYRIYETHLIYKI